MQVYTFRRRTNGYHLLDELLLVRFGIAVITLINVDIKINQTIISEQKVIEFSSNPKHDRLPPHRQNRLCGSKSSEEIIFSLPEIKNAPSNPNQDTKPKFEYFQMIPFVYVAIDTSKPSSEANAGTV